MTQLNYFKPLDIETPIADENQEQAIKGTVPDLVIKYQEGIRIHVEQQLKRQDVWPRADLSKIDFEVIDGFIQVTSPVAEARTPERPEIDGGYFQALDAVIKATAPSR